MTALPLVAALADAGPKSTAGGVALITLVVGVPVVIVVLFVRWIIRSTRDANRPFDDHDENKK